MDTTWVGNYPYLVAFIAGLSGVVHCVGMCGGIVGILSVTQQPDGKPISRRKQIPILLGYNFGRISGYMVAGALLGALGASLIGLSGIEQTKQVLAVIAAAFMLLLGLYLAGFWNALVKVETAGASLWKRIEPYSRRFIPVTSVKKAIPLGFLWGWLPCGLVYTALIIALSSGSAIKGALIMLAFGLGTLPSLLAMGIIANQLVGFTRKPAIRMIAGILVILMGLITLLNAFIL